MESRIAFKRAAFRRAAVGWLERDAEHGGCVWGALTTSAQKSLFWSAPFHLSCSCYCPWLHCERFYSRGSTRLDQHKSAAQPTIRNDPDAVQQIFELGKGIRVRVGAAIGLGRGWSSWNLIRLCRRSGLLPLVVGFFHCGGGICRWW